MNEELFITLSTLIGISIGGWLSVKFLTPWIVRKAIERQTKEEGEPK